LGKKNIKYLLNISAGMYLLRDVLVIFFLPLLFISCEAPRSNPADPMNDDNSDNVTIEGTVQTLSLPYTPLSKVLVLWIPENSTGVVRETDSKGYFVISNIDPVNGILVFEKEGYMADTMTVIWSNNNKVITKTVNLNEIPRLDSVTLSTTILNTEPGVYSSELSISTVISDKDNDIDSVYVIIPGLKVSKGLDFNVTSKTYQAAFIPEDLDVDDIEKAVGYDFNFYVKDIFNKTFFVGSERISRVIKDNVNLISPSGNAETDSVPVFRWEKYNAGFEFTYTLEIYTNDFVKQLVSRVGNLPPDTSAYRLQKSLASNGYSWVIWIVDKYNNRSMSVPAAFVVK
jgi:hypothetical protein